MKIKTADLIGPALDWAVAKCQGVGIQRPARVMVNAGGYGPNGRAQQYVYSKAFGNKYSPSADPETGWPIIDENSISVIRIEDDYGQDAKGFCNNNRIPVWGAVMGQHGALESYNSYGEPCGSTYEIPEDDCSYGPTSLIAAMRCYVATSLGDEVEIPEELA